MIENALQSLPDRISIPSTANLQSRVLAGARARQRRRAAGTAGVAFAAAGLFVLTGTFSLVSTERSEVAAPGADTALSVERSSGLLVRGDVDRLEITVSVRNDSAEPVTVTRAELAGTGAVSALPSVLEPGEARSFKLSGARAGLDCERTDWTTVRIAFSGQDASGNVTVALPDSAAQTVNDTLTSVCETPPG